MQHKGGPDSKNSTNLGTEKNTEVDTNNIEDIKKCLDTEGMSDSEIERCIFWVQANRSVKNTKKYNFQEAKIQVNANWDVDAMERMLNNYEDKDIMKYIRYGWPLNATGTAINTEMPGNQKGATQNKEQVKKYIQDEISNGSIIGPFKTNPFGKDARFSPIDTRPKRDSSDLRIILNLSHPFEEGSVNESINKERYVDGENMEVRYPSVDDLCKIIRKKKIDSEGQPTKKVKVMKKDLSKAYRQLWMDPSSIEKLGFIFDEQIFFDVCLSMGSKSAAYCCQRTTTAITHIYKNMGYEDVNYLDDLGAAEEEDKAEGAFQCLGAILNEIGIRESRSKACPPAFIMVFLGILINTITMTLTIPEDRKVEIGRIIKQWEYKKCATMKELQSLLGKLNFVCSTVRAGRIFISRIINELKSFPNKGKRRLSSELKQDIMWWKRFMSEFDGTTIMPQIAWDRPDSVIATDATLKGAGGWAPPEFFATRFPSFLTERSDVAINELELTAFMIAIRKWKGRLRHKNILCYCDNQCTVEILNSGKAKNKYSQSCLREIAYILARNNCQIKVIYLASEENRIPDLLSRWEDTKICRKKLKELTEGIKLQEIKITNEDYEHTVKW